MAQVKVLIEGYAKQLKNGWVASSTTCLVEAENKKIVTDPGCNRKKLLDALKKEKEGGTIDSMKSATEALSTEMQKIGEYMSKNPPAASVESSGEPKEGEVKDAEVKEEKKEEDNK